MTGRMLNRVAAILKPSQTMLDWINENPDNEEMLALEDVQSDCTVILLPFFTNEEEAEDYLSSICEELFDNELTLWNEDESSWPEDRSIQTFLEWFDIEFHTIVYDVAEMAEFSLQAREEILQ